MSIWRTLYLRLIECNAVGAKFKIIIIFVHPIVIQTVAIRVADFNLRDYKFEKNEEVFQFRKHANYYGNIHLLTIKWRTKIIRNA